jgi:hypothetical protein
MVQYLLDQLVTGGVGGFILAMFIFYSVGMIYNGLQKGGKG